MRHKLDKRRGFSIPVILVLSLAVIGTLLSLLNVGYVMRNQAVKNHDIQLAEEAAEAGLAYATSCLENNDRVQTWSASNPLKPSTNCNGTADVYPGNQYVYSDNRSRTHFVVTDADFTIANSIQISATGYTEILTGGGPVIKTYTTTLKKVITWQVDFQGQKSVSGKFRTCGILSGDVYCWGWNNYGQLGDGTQTDTLTPVKVKKGLGVLAGKTVTDMFAAQYHNCALATGKVYCWGWNNYGQLGDGTQTNSSVPIEVGGDLAGKTVTNVGGSGRSSCAIAEGKIYCWGENIYGTVGNGSTINSFTTPQLVSSPGTSTTLPTSYTATELSTSGSDSTNMCAIANDQAYCWGVNDQGSVGDNTLTDRTIPTKVHQESGVLLGKKVVEISQDSAAIGSGTLPHTCVVATDSSGNNGKAYCWGHNNHGQLGDNTTTTRLKPTAVKADGASPITGKVITDISVGYRHSCLIADDEAYCWGYNSRGQVGDNTNTQRYMPTRVAQNSGGLLGKTVVNVGGGANRGCAITLEGKTFCWGRNTEGQIGDGTTINRSIPTESLFLRPRANQYIY